MHHCKHCPTHGTRRWLISRNGDLYARFDRYYHGLFPPEDTPPTPVDTHFFITNSCNQACDYCAAEANQYEYFMDFDSSAFQQAIKNNPGAKISLIGGEPLRHPHIFDFVKMIENEGKTAVIFTNGIAFSDEAKVKELMEKSASRCEMRMSFEGFSERAYQHLPGHNLRSTKLAALENLKKHSVPITLGHTISLEEQADKSRCLAEMRSIMEFGMREKFVRGLTFRSLAALGGVRHLGPEEVMSIDQVMDWVVEACPVPISRRDAYLSQRLVQAMARIFGLPSCEYVQTAVLFRRGDSWVGIEELFNCDRLERRLDARATQWPQSRSRAIAAFAADLLASVRPTRITTLMSLGMKVLPMFTNRYDFAAIPDCILPLNASTVCDRHNLDSSVARRCEKTVFYQNDGLTVTETTSQMAVRHMQLRPRTPQDGPTP